MYNPLPLHLAPHHIIPPHFILHHSTSNTISDIPKLTTFHVTPDHSSPYHTFHITPAPPAATLQYRISNRTIIICLIMHQPHLALHPILDNVPCTPRHISDHTIYWPHYALHHHISHQATLYTIAPHFTCRATSCIFASVHHI